MTVCASAIKATQALLKMNGFRVLVARDGDEAFLIAAAELPHLIVTDWMMPRMDAARIVLAAESILRLASD